MVTTGTTAVCGTGAPKDAQKRKARFDAVPRLSGLGTYDADGLIGAVFDVSGVELAELVRQLRSELNESLADAEGERLRFELGPVEVTLTVTVGREAAPGAKVRFWVIEAGADARLSREAVQEIKLMLTPVDTQAPPGPDGKTAAPLITGGVVKGER